VNTDSKVRKYKESSWELLTIPQTEEIPVEVCSAMKVLKCLGWADLNNKLLLQVFTGTLCLLFLTPKAAKHSLQSTFPSISNTEMCQHTNQTSTQFLVSPPFRILTLPILSSVHVLFEAFKLFECELT